MMDLDIQHLGSSLRA